MCHIVQLTEKPGAIPAEEIGIGLQNEGDVEQRNTSILQCLHIVEPKLVLNEKSRHKMMALHPLCGMLWRVGGEIKHLVSQRIVFPYFVTGRGEKRQQNLELGIVFLQCLDDWSALLKLA